MGLQALPRKLQSSHSGVSEKGRIEIDERMEPHKGPKWVQIKI